MTKRTSRHQPRSQQRLDQQAPTLAGHRVRDARPQGRGRSWLGSALLLGLSLLFLVQFLADARFRVAQVTVAGVDLVPWEDVSAKADLLGRPIFTVNARRIEAQLMAAFECLGRVRVQTRLPDRVHIQVTQKDALLLWESGGVYWWVDGEGKVLGLAGNRGDLPAVHDRSELSVAPGDYIVGVPWGYAIEMSRALPTARDFEFTLEDGLILITEDGWPVYLGVSGNAAQKAQVLHELTRALETRGGRVLYVDLKNERRPAVKLGSG
jgi:cell division septal protein FtsQ